MFDHVHRVVGPFRCNCHLLSCAKSGEAVIIDPGDEDDELLALVKKKQFHLEWILLTHAHIDHIAAAETLRRETGARVVLHPADAKLAANIGVQAELFGLDYRNFVPPSIDVWLNPGQEFAFGDHALRAIHTPGHSPGGTCFHHDGEEKWLFSGDALFAGSIGRTDLWGANGTELLESIHGEILRLPGTTKVLPGHGEFTTVDREKKTNPFLQKR